MTLKNKIKFAVRAKKKDGTPKLTNNLCAINFSKSTTTLGGFVIQNRTFLNNLVVNKQVSSSTQNLALCAVIFMHRLLLNWRLQD